MNKGFTLIELLATIVIMTVILLMVLPSITALQENNEDRPYEYYGESIEEAAKTYVTKEGEDITDLGVEQWEGCVDITYDDLISSGLIKPFDDPNYNCSINTKVRYTKDAEGRETFEYNMTCEDEEGNKVYEHKGIEDDGECTVIDQSDFTPPECGEAIGESTEWTTEERTITMTCHDENGCESVTKTFDKSTKIGYITVEDGKGNKRNCPVNVYIDKTPPKCSSSGGSDSWTNGSRTLTGTCSDDESGCVGNVSKLYNSEGNFTSQSPGTVSDKVGNTTVCPNNQTVKIDKTPPTFEARYLSNFYLPTNNTVNRRVTQTKVSDNLSGVSTATYTMPFTVAGTFVMTYTEAQGATPVENFALSSTSNANFSIVATDRAGNTGRYDSTYYNLGTSAMVNYR